MNLIDRENYQNSCLVVGNSRWHWAFQKIKEWEFFDTSIKNEILKALDVPLRAWAAVGPIPKNIQLDNNAQKIELEDIPLLRMPSWLGIDRALASWGAFKKAKELSLLHRNGILVADAGTVLSITKISAKGEFAGGQLSAGLHLQLKAMNEWTQHLSYPLKTDIPKEKFPVLTADAMKKGSLNSLIGSLMQAQADAEAPIWLCGGDSEIIFNSISNEKVEAHLHPNLVLEGMINIIK
tara:strand:+ start:4439 stop:5149 length:711 start_codon:yes stop_codon:yes gene_type:complete